MKNIKSTTGFLLIVLFACTLSSCGGKGNAEKAEDRFGKMEVVIPDALKDNPEIVKYIQGMSEIVDEYALLMDDMIAELDGIDAENWDELKIGEQLKITKAGAKFAIKAAPITAKWGEYEAERAIAEGELTEEQLVALESVMDRFEKRMEQIEEKNTEFFGNLNS